MEEKVEKIREDDNSLYLVAEGKGKEMKGGGKEGEIG